MERSQFVEVRWHARAGQGVVTAAKTLAETALREGKYGQAFPEYGPERSGAPIKAYNRISDLPIRIYSQVLEPDVVIVSDPTLLRSEQILAGAKDNTIVIVNSPDPPETVASRIGSGKLRVYVVNASQIAFEETKKHFPNPPLLGALIRATDIVSVEQILAQMKDDLGKKVASAALEANLKALKRGHDEVRSAAASKADGARARSDPRQPGWKDMLPGSVIEQAGNASEYMTGSWRTSRPVLNDKCNSCLLCWFFCPDGAVVVKDGTVVGFDLDHCKGCGICSEVCPPKIKAIDMTEEPR